MRRLTFWIDKIRGSVHVLPVADKTDLAVRIAEESAALPRDKQSAVLKFILFVKERGDGDAAWEQIIGRPEGYPKLAAFLRASAQEGEEPLHAGRW